MFAASLVRIAGYHLTAYRYYGGGRVPGDGILRQMRYAVAFGQGRITGTFDITCQEDADDMISMINAVKSFLKNKEAAH